MKIRGKEFKTRNREVIPFTRNGEVFAFIAEAVTSYEEFDKLVEFPIAPEIMKPGGVKTRDVDSKQYREAMEKYATLKSHWLMLTSLRATEDLEWETVDYNKPDTWEKFPDELRNAGFTEFEMQRIMEGVWNANGLTTKAIEQARDDFLAGKVLPVEQ